MPAFRIVPCLDVRAGRVVKGVNFRHLRDSGDPAELAVRYRNEGADELVLLDVAATLEGRLAMLETVRRVAEVLDIPFTVGGGVRGEEDAAALLAAGADKVALNTAAVTDPPLLTRLAERFGSQCVVLAVDVRRGPAGFQVTTHAAGRLAGLEVCEWVARAEALGAGEILLTSIDRDGTGRGFDEELLATVRPAVTVPIVASGGGETPAHFVAAAQAGADAGLAATIFHQARVRIEEIKRALAAAEIPVRLEERT